MRDCTHCREYRNWEITKIASKKYSLLGFVVVFCLLSNSSFIFLFWFFSLHWQRFISPLFSLFFLYLTYSWLFFITFYHFAFAAWGTVTTHPWRACKVHMTESARSLVVTVFKQGIQCFFNLHFFVVVVSKTGKKNLVCISTSSILLWGLSDTRHKLWLWMALWWPRCRCDTGTQTHVESHSFIVVTNCKHTCTHTHT